MRNSRWWRHSRPQPNSGGAPSPFADAALARQFETDGFIVVDLLDAEVCASLVAAHHASAVRLDRSDALASGFHTTMYEPGVEHRRSARDQLARALGPPLTALAPGQRVFVANYLTKVAGAGAIAPHVDWSYVDEDRHRTLTVWCPLTPVTRDSGTLGVVPGSHRQVDFVRPVNRRDLDTHLAAGARCGPIRHLTLAAGQAVVMDGRLLHSSEPNRSSSTRVVAGCVAAPEDADLCLFWEDGRAVHRTSVAPDFYLTYQPGTAPASCEHAGTTTVLADVRVA